MSVKTISDKGMETFLNARFGMFIHWGLYSILGRGEWVMHNERIPVETYAALASQFNPVHFNADTWVAQAVDAGQKYMVITSRHHDGFSMYDTALSDYKVTHTPFHRDPLAELANACARRSDMKLGFYSSLLDWHHPAYRFRQLSGLAWSDYLTFLHGQVRELCTQFGEIACIWFDGDWPRQPFDETNAYFAPGGSFEYEKLYDMIHTLQPDAYIINNRHAEPVPGEDVQGFEQDLPGDNSAGFNTTQTYNLPYEICMTMNDSWGVNDSDHNHKSPRRLLQTLVKSAGLNANYLLNVGPTADGEILPVHVQRLKELGDWLAINRESIYGTRAGVISTPDGVSTSCGNVHYVHVLHYNWDDVTLEGVPGKVKKVVVLNNGYQPSLEQTDGKVRVNIPAEQRDLLDTVIKLDLAA
jgi:alpha-L-fucosidase